MKSTRFFAGLALFAAMTAPPAIVNAQGIPVIDGANLVETKISVYEAVQQGVYQLEQLKTQYSQYENELRNTLAPGFYVWDQVNIVADESRNALSMVDYYKRHGAGNLERYLESFKTPAGYRRSPCFAKQGCPPEELLESRDQAAEGTKHAIDSQVRIIDQQLGNIRNDSANLTRIQQSAEAAEGRMEAAQTTNQLLSNQANQFLAIRTLMVAQQQSEAARLQEVANTEAQQQAAGAALRRNNYKPSAVRTWSIR